MLKVSSVLIPVQSIRTRICMLLLASLFNMGIVRYLKGKISLDKKLQSRDLTFLLASDVIKH